MPKFLNKDLLAATHRQKQDHRIMQPTIAQDVKAQSTVPLITPAKLLRELPVPMNVEKTVAAGREQIRSVLNGADSRFMVVVGPCSIHDEEAALEYAEKLLRCSRQLADRLLVVMRVYFEKPRTTTGWKGLIYDPHLDQSFDIEAGLRRARSLLLSLADMGIHAGTEFLDPIVPQYLADLVSWATIGARTTESQTHRQMASSLNMPVGFKNGTDGNVQVAIDAAVSARSPHGFLGLDAEGRTAIVRSSGNPDGHLVLRGGNHKPNYDQAAIAQAQIQLRDAGVNPQLLVDCSHGNSNKEHQNQSSALFEVVTQRMKGNKNIVGCMLESNLNPGNQHLNGDASGLKYGVSITDACIGWDETEELLTWIHRNAS